MSYVVCKREDKSINIGDFIEYVVLRGRSKHRCVKYGTVAMHNGRPMIRLYGHKDVYAKFYAGIIYLKVLSIEEKKRFMADNQKKYLLNKVKYINYILSSKSINFFKKFWYIKTYGLTLSRNLR